MAEIGDQDQPNQNSRSLLKVASAIGSGVGTGILLAKEEERARKKEEEGQKSQQEFELEGIFQRINYITRKLESLRNNPTKDPLEQQNLLRDLGLYQDKAVTTMREAGIDPSDSRYASILAASGQEMQKSRQDIETNTAMRSFTPFTINGIQYYTELEYARAFAALEETHRVEMERTNQVIAENNRGWQALDNLMKSIGFMDEATLKEMAAQNPEFFMKHLLEIKSIMYLRGALLEDTKRAAEVQEQQIMQKAERCRIEGSNPQEVAQLLNDRVQSGEILPDFLQKLLKDIKDFKITTDNIKNQESELTKLQEYHKGVEAERQAKGLPPISMDKLVEKINSDSDLTKQHKRLVDRAVEMAGVEEAARIKEFKNEQKAEEKASVAKQDLDNKAKEETKDKIISKGIDTDLKELKANTNELDNNTKETCEAVAAEWGILPNEIEGKSGKEIYTVLQEKLRADPKLLEKHPDTAEFFKIIEDAYSPPKPEGQQIIPPQIEGAVPEPSAPSIEPIKGEVKDIKKLGELAKIAAKVPTKEELETAPQNTAGEEVKNKNRDSFGRS